jgi:hypothetical protein
MLQEALNLNLPPHHPQFNPNSQLSSQVGTLKITKNTNNSTPRHNHDSDNIHKLTIVQHSLPSLPAPAYDKHCRDWVDIVAAVLDQSTLMDRYILKMKNHEAKKPIVPIPQLAIIRRLDEAPRQHTSQHKKQRTNQSTVPQIQHSTSPT